MISYNSIRTEDDLDLRTEDDLLNFFKFSEVGAGICFFTTPTILIETNIFKLDLAFLNRLHNSVSFGVHLLFKQHKGYDKIYRKYKTHSTYPAEYGLKTFDEVVQLLRTQSICFIMDD